MASLKELETEASVLRRDSLTMTTEAGSGHPTSCLSCADLLSYLFFNKMSFDKANPNNSNNDEFILSKGHAAPILYSALYHAGCIKSDLNSLRKLSSNLEGHPTPNLNWIKVATGSLGQGLGAGLGMALAARLQNKDFNVYVLLGDSEMAEGSNYEAMEIASFYNLNNLVAIVDANRLGQTGQTISGHKLDQYRDKFLSFGWHTQVIDGHNFDEIENAFNSLSKTKPNAIIAKTFKGYPISFLSNQEGWHGRALTKEELKKALSELPDVKFPKIKLLSPKDEKEKSSPIVLKENHYQLDSQLSSREAYGRALASLAQANPKVLVLDGEVSNSTFTDLVKIKTPKQFVQCYIAEQNMISMALGLSKKGFNVFTTTFSAFLSRAHDQLRMAAISKGNFTVCGSHSGVSIGEDGASQMGLEDLAMFRDLPDSIVLSPSDAVSTEKLLFLSAKSKGIKYIRTSRPKTPVIYSHNEKFQLGEFKVLRQSKKDSVVLIGSGITLHESLKAHEIIKKQLSTAVIDLYCIKPLNVKSLISFIKKHGNKVVITEDHYLAGGIGEMLSEYLDITGIKIKHLYVSVVPHSGTKDQLLEKYGINWKAISKAAKDLIKK
jgi:transketolase